MHWLSFALKEFSQLYEKPRVKLDNGNGIRSYLQTFISLSRIQFQKSLNFHCRELYICELWSLFIYCHFSVFGTRLSAARSASSIETRERARELYANSRIECVSLSVYVYESVYVCLKVRERQSVCVYVFPSFSVIRLSQRAAVEERRSTRLAWTSSRSLSND
jgi:hypothetical protein